MASLLATVFEAMYRRRGLRPSHFVDASVLPDRTVEGAGIASMAVRTAGANQ